MKTKCRICNSQSRFLLTKSGYDLWKCPSCKLVFVYPYLTDKFLKEEVYNNYEYQAGKVVRLSLLPENKVYKKVFNHLNKKSGKILDVGCSNGEFLYMAKKRGFEAYGVELNKITVKIARQNKLKVYNGNLIQAKYKSNFFDVIFLGDVIEHLTNPEKIIKECVRILKKDGRLVIITPNLDCFWANITYYLCKFLKIPWSSVTPPYHLFQFSTDNLMLFMKKYGFLPNSKWYNPPPKLSYEMWFTGWAEKVSKKRSLTNLLTYYCVYFIYGFFYLINKLIVGLVQKDNSINVIFRFKDSSHKRVK